MSDGDVRYYTNAALGMGTVQVSALPQPNSFTVSESFSGSASYYGFSALGDQLFSSGGSLANTSMTFSPGVLVLDESLVADGGSRTSSTTVAAAGTNLPASLTVTVSQAGTTTVPAGTFQNCRQVNVAVGVSIPGQGTQQVQANAYVMAPGVGIVRIALFDTNMQVSGWAELAGGNVDGVNTASLAAQSAQVPAEISTQPLSLVLSSSTKTATFSVAATGTGLNYRWSKDGVPITKDSRITGGDSSTLSFKSVQKSDAGSYTVLVSNSLCSVVSAPATLSFAAAAPASYVGLFSQPAQPSYGSGGSISLNTTVRHTYSGKIQLAGKTYPLTGTFDPSGNASQTVLRPGMAPLQVQLHADLEGSDRLVGSISDGVWTSPVLARKVVFNAKTNPCPYAGNYTLVIPGAQTSSSPEGHSYGTVTINAAGQVRFSGSLADGAAVSQTSTLSSDGQWPLYASLYGGQGHLLGWISFAQRPNDDLNGSLDWARGASVYVKYYRSGFTNQVSLTGSRYTAPALGGRALGWSTGSATFSGGDLAGGLANNVCLGSNGLITGSGNDKLTFSIAKPNGLFKGTFMAPGSTKPSRVQGVLLQKINRGYGYFFGQSQSGAVTVTGN